MQRYSIWYRVWCYHDEREVYEHVKDLEGDWETVKRAFVQHARQHTGYTVYLTAPDLTEMPEQVYGEARFPRAVKR